MGEMASRSELIKLALTAILGIAGGIIILVIGNLNFIAGLILGIIILFAGMIILASGKNRLTGLITTGSGIFLLVSYIPLLGSLAKGLIILSGIILLIAGAIAAFLFIKNFISRV